MSWLPLWRATRGQRRHHRPFRIAEPDWTAGGLARLAELIEELATTPSMSDAGRTEPLLGEKQLAEAGTNLWRARRRLTRMDGVDTREHKWVGRYLLATQQELDAAGMLIQDHDRDDYHPGLSLEVVAFQDVPELDREVVWETLRPSVYLAGRRIQMAQVIVGRPKNDSTETEEPHA